jgi:transcriptional regulator with XRE-family HTH domain
VARPRKRTIGQRIQHYRKDAGLTLSQLAEAAQVSKSYLSELESDTEGSIRPSADVLYRLGKALGVAMSDLLGRDIIIDREYKPSPSLLKFANQAKLPEGDIKMLAQIHFRGEQPSTPERWSFIYQAIKSSAAMDR